MMLVSSHLFILCFFSFSLRHPSSKSITSQWNPRRRCTAAQRWWSVFKLDK